MTSRVCFCVCVCRLYRLEYDVAVGVSGHTAKDTALCETTQPTEPMPYNSADEFAVWCKTLLHPGVDWQVAGALAGARMAGRVWSWVHHVDELRPGDHIALNFGALYYYQHAIVNRVEGIFSLQGATRLLQCAARGRRLLCDMPVLTARSPALREGTLLHWFSFFAF